MAVTGKVRAVAFAGAVLAAGLAITGDVNAFASLRRTSTDSAPFPLDGTYRVDVLGSRGTFNGQPRPRADSVRWYSIASTCTPAGCTAEATQLDNANHGLPHPVGRNLEFTFEHGQWVGTPFTDTSPCLAVPDAVVPLSVAWVLRPGVDGTLTGNRVITELDRGDGVCAGTGGVHDDPLLVTPAGAAPNRKGKAPT
jgi:serine/threonine-protein kinase